MISAAQVFQCVSVSQIPQEPSFSEVILGVAYFMRCFCCCLFRIGYFLVK